MKPAGLPLSHPPDCPSTNNAGREKARRASPRMQICARRNDLCRLGRTQLPGYTARMWQLALIQTALGLAGGVCHEWHGSNVLYITEV